MLYLVKTNWPMLSKGKSNCYAVVMDASKPDSVERGTEEAISILGGDSVDLVVYFQG